MVAEGDMEGVGVGAEGDWVGDRVGFGVGASVGGGGTNKTRERTRQDRGKKVIASCM